MKLCTFCTWCGTEFEPRKNGGSPQRFCTAPCRRAFETACRAWAAQEHEAGRVSTTTLRTALHQRARCLESDPASERVKPPEVGTRPDGLTGAVAPEAA